ncbi:MAG: DNA repair exonuclease [Peptostreptococcales bacterium]
MKSIKILHCADFHLDAPLVNLDKNKAAIRREELIEGFGRILFLAKDENVDFVFISGDLFDGRRVGSHTIDFIKKSIEELDGIPVILAAGNHDCLLGNVHYSQTKWPSNFYIFTGSMERIDFPEKNCCIYGRSFNNPYAEEGYLRDFKVEDDDRINIMVMHGDILKNSKYNPITIEEIGDSGLDYLALGHIHKFSGIQKVKSTSWAYPGTPEGIGFDETGEKGVIIGEIFKNHVQLDFKKTCKRQYRQVVADITDLTTYDEIVNKISESFDDESQNNFYRVLLNGFISGDFIINTEVLWHKLKEDTYDLKIYNDRLFDMSGQEDENTLVQVFMNHIKSEIEKSDDNERDILNRAFMLGLYAMKGQEIGFDEDT